MGLRRHTFERAVLGNAAEGSGQVRVALDLTGRRRAAIGGQERRLARAPQLRRTDLPVIRRHGRHREALLRQLYCRLQHLRRKQNAALSHVATLQGVSCCRYDSCRACGRLLTCLGCHWRNAGAIGLKMPGGGHACSRLNVPKLLTASSQRAAAPGTVTHSALSAGSSCPLIPCARTACSHGHRCHHFQRLPRFCCKPHQA